MPKVDLICQYCVYCDYPIFRSHLKKYRDKYNKIILYPSRQHGFLDLENFAKSVIKETWIEREPIDYGVEDWRQAETTPCLKQSDAEWIRFAEQDFFVRDWDKFYADVEKAMQTSDMIGWWNPTHFPYVHPSCLYIKRELLEKTTIDFRAHPEINGADHFSMLTRDAEKLGAKITTLQDLGYEDWKDAFHLGGLTYVYQDWKEDGSNHIGVKRPEVFKIYNQMLRKANVEQKQEFINLTYKVEEQLNKMNLSVDENSYWEDFFK